MKKLIVTGLILVILLVPVSCAPSRPAGPPEPLIVPPTTPEPITVDDLTPEKESSFNVRLESKKGGKSWSGKLIYPSKSSR